MGSDSILAGIGATVLAVTLLVCGFAACCLPVTTASLAGAVSTGADSPYTHEQLVSLAQETRAFTVDAHSSMEEARESLAADVVAAAREASAEGAPKYSQWTQQAKQVLGDAEGEGGAVAADDGAAAGDGSALETMDALAKVSDRYALDADAVSHLEDCNGLITGLSSYLGMIGVAALIIITSLGNGMQNYMNAQFEQLGSNLIQVMVYGRGEGGTRDVNTEDMYALVEKYPQYLSGVTPYVSATAKVRQGTEDFDRTSIYGVSEAFYRADTQKTMQGSSLENGRFLRYIDVERHQNVCVIGSYLAENAFRTDPLGQTISVSGVPYMVVGVLAESGDSTEGSVDDVIYIPYANAQRLGGGYGDMYLMTSTDRDTASAAKGIIENRLFKTYQSSDYYMVMTSAEMMDAMDSMLNTLMMILILIAAISLLVGGIGIMNIMLVSVTERTREIGIRKSLGAKCRDIRSQFIIEAGTTSAIGGAIGIILGILMANVLTNVIALVLGTGNYGFVAMPTAGGIGVAFGVSVAVGILFGYLPANKAAKLNPIDALRYD